MWRRIWYGSASMCCLFHLCCGYSLLALSPSLGNRRRGRINLYLALCGGPKKKKRRRRLPLIICTFAAALSCNGRYDLISLMRPSSFSLVTAGHLFYLSSLSRNSPAVTLWLSVMLWTAGRYFLSYDRRYAKENKEN